MKEPLLRKYRFFDHLDPVGRWVYFEGETKYDGLERNFGKEQARIILATFKIERVYDSTGGDRRCEE